MTSPPEPRLLVLSYLFPSDAQPGAGLFIRERMFRVGREIPIVVVAPQPWFPLQGLIRMFRPHFRPMARRFELVDGIEVHRPRFLSVPGILKRLDGFFLALASLRLTRELARTRGVNLIDAHFGYPDGYAANLLSRWTGLPYCVTLRGKERRQSKEPVAPLQREAMRGARRVFSVSAALRQLAIDEGVAPERTMVVGNGVDLHKFAPMPREDARAALGLPPEAWVLVSVGTLIERKGFHRVIERLPALLRRFPDLHYLVVGGPGPEGDISARLHEQVRSLGLVDRVHFTGSLPPERLKFAYSAADVFVLATGYEGWANVFLEAMACGLPVVTTDVGGNAEVVSSPRLGVVVPFGDGAALEAAIADALERVWDRSAIIAYAGQHGWDRRIAQLTQEFRRLVALGDPASVPGDAALPGSLR